MLSVPFPSISFAAGLTGGNATRDWLAGRCAGVLGRPISGGAIVFCGGASGTAWPAVAPHNKAQPAAIDARRRLAVEIWAEPGRGEICMEATLPSRGSVCLIA
jgi:hypothetical protein